MDEGTTVSLPNSLVILGALISHDLHERWVRVKYEVPTTVDPELAIARIRDAVVADEWVVGKRTVKVYVNQATQSSYVISVDALCSGALEEPPRSALYIRMMAVVAGLARAGAAAPTRPPADPSTPAPPGPGPPPTPGSAAVPGAPRA
jgi:small-conductance mechanosensitive channel